MADPPKYFVSLSSSQSITIASDSPISIELQQQCHQQPPNSSNLIKLWLFDDCNTNYVVWRAHVHDQFKRDGLLAFIDGTETPPPPKTVSSDEDGGVFLENPDYNRWREDSDNPVKERLLSLLDQDIVPLDHEQKSSREIWLDLKKQFIPLVTREAEWVEGVYKSVDTGTTSEYLKLHRAALLGDKWAGLQLFQNVIGEMVRNNVIAERIGNSAVMIISNNKKPVVHDDDEYLYTTPVYARKEVLEYFIQKINHTNRTTYAETARLAVLLSAIDAEHFKFASDLLEEKPYLAGLRLSNKSALTCLASNQSMFARRIPSITSPFERLLPKALPFSGVKSLFNFVIVPGMTFSDYTETMEFDGTCMEIVEIFLDLLAIFMMIISVVIAFICCIPLVIINTLYWLPWKFLKTVGFVEKHKEMMIDAYALSLLTKLCEDMKELSGSPEEVFGEAVLFAARLGVHVVVEEILKHSPAAAFCCDPVSSQYIFHMAVESRDQRLLGIIHEKLRGDTSMRLPFDIPDSHGNNILHLAAKLSPPDVLDKIPGSVLQIQHELKWFKEIEKITSPPNQVKLNDGRKTPKMIFMEEHMGLKDKSEKWMKDTATSCTIIAALIGTIMFAAAITVPGGNDQNTGIPMFNGRYFVFTLFAISDAISFIMSVISLLMFMEIMMSRYEVEDFMRQLPVRLFIGLGSLFISIFFMMLSFSFTVYLVFGRPRHWVLISVVTVTCYVVLLFGYLQGSLLLELVSSTYSGGFIRENNVQTLNFLQRFRLTRPIQSSSSNHEEPGKDPLDIL